MTLKSFAFLFQSFQSLHQHGVLIMDKYILAKQIAEDLIANPLCEDSTIILMIRKPKCMQEVCTFMQGG